MQDSFYRYICIFLISVFILMSILTLKSSIHIAAVLGDITQKSQISQISDKANALVNDISGMSNSMQQIVIIMQSMATNTKMMDKSTQNMAQQMAYLSASIAAISRRISTLDRSVGKMSRPMAWFPF